MVRGKPSSEVRDMFTISHDGLNTTEDTWKIIFTKEVYLFFFYPVIRIEYKCDALYISPDK